MRVLVCGGRDYGNITRVAQELDALVRLHGPLTVIEGGAAGADQIARTWAYHVGATIHTFQAEWAKHGRAAGPIRNQEMLEKGKPELVLAFPGGRGTADMVRRAKLAGVPVKEI
jgi:predicted Rossmann-fold nucleotide-binding protein